MIHHKPCTEWTIRIETEGMTFFITGILFSDIALAAAKGIEEHCVNTKTKVYYASDNIKEPQK